MGTYKYKQREIEAVNAGELIASPEGDWAALPDWLRLECEKGEIKIEPGKVTIMASPRPMVALAADWIIFHPAASDISVCRGSKFHDMYDAVPARPVVQIVGEAFTCGSREQQGRATPDLHEDHWHKQPNGDRTCSYCGSLHEADFFEILTAYADGQPGYHFDPTTKGYKKYANRPGVRNAGDGGIKFYGWHADMTEGPELDGKNEVYRRAMLKFRSDYVKAEEVTG